MLAVSHAVSPGAESGDPEPPSAHISVPHFERCKPSQAVNSSGHRHPRGPEECERSKDLAFLIALHVTFVFLHLLAHHNKRALWKSNGYGGKLLNSH